MNAKEILNLLASLENEQEVEGEEIENQEQEELKDKTRREKQNHYMKKYTNNPENDNDGISTDGVQNYHWDNDVKRIPLG